MQTTRQATGEGEAGWSVREFVGTRSRKGRVAPYYMPIPGVRPEWDLDC